jgi:hypothetical protein
MMKRINENQKRFQALSQTSEGNGKGLDKATLDSVLDRLIETMDGVNRELDALLTKAKE